jgi:hypothetical protein
MATIQVGSVDEINALPPIRRLLVLVMLLAIKDRASSVSHEYGSGLSKLAYLVDDQWFDLVPIPEILGPYVGQEIRQWINPSRFRRSVADRLREMATRLDPNDTDTTHYSFLLIVDSLWSLWRMTNQSQPDRGHVKFDLLECTDLARAHATDLLKDLLDSKKTQITDQDLANFRPSLR